MHYSLHPRQFNRVLLPVILAVFSVSTVPLPIYAFEEHAVNIGAANFAFKMEKLVKKIHKYKDSMDSNKLLETMAEIKMEVEAFSGQKIDIDKHLDEVEKESKKSGAKLDKEEMKKLRKVIKGHVKHAEHKAMWLAECSEEVLLVGFDEVIAKKDNEKTTRRSI